MYIEKKRADVLFLIEHKDRELNSICAITTILKNKYNLSIAIGSINFHTFIALLMVRPKVIVVPFALNETDFPIGVFRALYRDTITYVSMNLEQILHANNIEYKRPRDYFTRNVLQHFCWNENFRAFLLSSGVKKENIYITGNPATELLLNVAQTKLTIRNELANKYNLDKNAVWHFFPMNDGWAFMSKKNIIGRISDGYNAENAWKYKEYMIKLINQIAKWLVQLSENYKGKYIIILRPHPSVSIDEYVELFHQLIGYVPENVVLSKELSSREWTVACDSCFTTFSTVALDADMLNKPTYLLEPIPFPEFLQVPQLERIPKIQTFGEFVEILKQIDSLTIPVKPERGRVNPIGKTAEYLAGLVARRKSPQLNFSGLIRCLSISPKPLLGSLVRLFAIILGFKPFGILKPGMIPDYFSSKDIKNFMENVIDNELKN